MAYLDAHCHLADPRFDEDRDAVLARAEAAGVRWFFQGGVDPGDWARQSALADRRWFLSFGLHPWWVADHDDDACDRALAELGQALAGAHALGELGLDFFPRLPKSSHDRQRRLFRLQLQLARRLEKPLVLHLVRCHGEALAIMKQEGGRFRGIVHGFAGSYAVAEAYMAMGLLISVGGALTREGRRKLKDAVCRIPGDRLVIESDAPDMAPQSFRGRRNEPASVWDTARAAADLRGERAEDVLARGTANMARHFEWELAR